MKIFKHHSIMRCIYGILIALPMFAILGRVIYTQSNRNAKESYYGETINQSENINVTLQQMQPNYTYYFYNELNTATYTQYQTIDIYADNIYSNDTLITGYDAIRVYYTGSYLGLRFFNSETQAETSNNNLNNDRFLLQFTFQRYTSRNQDILNFINQFTYKIEYNKYSYLDNAFDYSLSTFVDVNHWGKLNFFEWFSSLFIDINSNNNALYMHFVNWYMNYVMFVSCAYILFLVLMWFINFSRRLLERGMNYDW